MCGYAVTAHVETVTASEEKDMNLFVRLYEAVAKSPKPAVVAFQEVGCHGDHAAHCGGVMAAIFIRLGAVGLVTDCGLRDIAEIRAANFQCYARGTVASHANFRIVRVGVPVQIAGLVVQPGDILHGDENGLLLVPKKNIEALPGAVETVRSEEGALLDFVHSPEFDLSRLRDRFLE
jgi:regulator of RNase E activity RraA